MHARSVVVALVLALVAGAVAAPHAPSRVRDQGEACEGAALVPGARSSLKRTEAPPRDRRLASDRFHSTVHGRFVLAAPALHVAVIELGVGPHSAGRTPEPVTRARAPPAG